MVSNFEYDPILGKHAAVAKIDDEHYLCIYNDGDLEAFVMELDGLYTMSIKSTYQLCTDPSEGRVPLIKIDSEHYLCMYSDCINNKTFAFILNVDSGWNISTLAQSYLEVADESQNSVDVTQLDTSTINKILQDRTWDSKLLDALEEYVTLEQSKRMYLCWVLFRSRMMGASVY